MEIIKILESQRTFFKTGKTRPIQFRIDNLKKLKKAIQNREQEFAEALKLDLGKSDVESYFSETGFLYPEIEHNLKHLSGWSQRKSVSSPISHFPTSSYYFYEPKGVVLNISPWNYPVNLCLAPLAASISAGNCTVIKPSEFTPNTNKVIAELIKLTFPVDFITTVEGEGNTVIPEMMNNFKFDHIFFTGSTAVGKIIAVEAAKELIPTTLELGGKTPCIVDRTANLNTTAKRIVFGKFLNAGQTCVAPDYLLVEESFADKLLESIKIEIEKCYTENPIDSPYLGKIINPKQRERLLERLGEGEIIYGKKQAFYREHKTKKIHPTLIKANKNSKLLTDEVFGPILPIITYKTEGEVFKAIEKNPNPLSLYVFSNNKQFIDRCLSEVSFGGGCVNNTIIHIANPNLPFGGTRQSGIGKYHGFEGFKELSNLKSISKSSSSIELPFRYPPYTNFKEKVIKLVI